MSIQVDVQIRVYGEREAESGFRLPLEAMPKELLPYLLRDMGLPNAVDNRRCFYRLRLRRAPSSFFRKAGEWIDLDPESPLERQFHADKNTWEVEIAELRGSGVHEVPGSMPGDHPREADGRTLRVEGKRRRRSGRGGAIDLDEPQRVSRSQRPQQAQRPRPEQPAPPRSSQQAAPLPVAPVGGRAERDDGRAARVVTVAVVRPSDDSFTPRREDLMLNLSGDQLAEMLSAQYGIEPPPRGDLWFCSPGSDFQPLPGGELLGHLGLMDDFEIRIGPPRGNPAEIVDAGESVGGEEAVARRGPDIPPEPPPGGEPTRPPPLWVWVLLFLLVLVLVLGSLVALKAWKNRAADDGPDDLPTAAPPPDDVTPAPGPSEVPVPVEPDGDGSAVDLGRLHKVAVQVPADPVTPAAGCRVDGRRTPCDISLAFDGRHDTAWCFKEADVGNVTVTIPLPPDAGSLVGVGVLNGYQKLDGQAGGKDRWAQNHRLQNLEIGGSVYALEDSREQEFLQLQPPVTAAQVVVSVGSIYRGTGGASADVCVSEITLAAAP